MIVHHAKQTLITHFDYNATKTTRAGVKCTHNIGGRMLSLFYKKSGKISTKKGGGLIIRHGRIIRILRYKQLRDLLD